MARRFRFFLQSGAVKDGWPLGCKNEENSFGMGIALGRPKLVSFEVKND